MVESKGIRKGFEMDSKWILHITLSVWIQYTRNEISGEVSASNKPTLLPHHWSLVRNR